MHASKKSNLHLSSLKCSDNEKTVKEKDDMKAIIKPN